MQPLVTQCFHMPADSESSWSASVTAVKSSSNMLWDTAIQVVLVARRWCNNGSGV